VIILESIFALLLTIILAASTLYLFIGFVVFPLIKIYKENKRLKQ